MQIFDTDYHSYAVGLSCLENETGDKHQKDYFVWVRHKEPSIYMRKRARNALIEAGKEPEGMVKGPLVKCWGNDL